MAKFIEIPVTSATAHVAGKKLINVEDVSVAFCSAANTVKLFLGTGSKHVALTTTAAKGIDVLNACNAAMTANPGGIKAKVQLAAGIEVTAIAVA
jgi:hypothetical protein